LTTRGGESTFGYVEDTPLVASNTIGDCDPPITEIKHSPVWQPPRSRINRQVEAAALGYIRSQRRSEALNVLAIAYGAPITTFAHRTVRNRELAKDIRQQVFLEAFQGIDKFQGRGSLWHWLCGIAYHRSIDHLRQLRRASARDNLELRDALVEPPDATIDADRAATQHALEQCMGKLHHAMRTQLVMRYYLGLTFAEIGETIGAPHSTVQVRLSRILPRLRRCLCMEGLTR
jgi:RNA polymerase sigma-70 factor, ECF subfamily